MIYSRRYWKEYAIWFVVFLSAMFLVKRATLWFPADSPARIALVVLPVLAAGGGFWVELRNLRRIDELQQRIYLESLFVGSFFLIAFCVGAAMAEIVLQMPRMSPLGPVFAMAFGCGIGLVIAKRRYR